MCWASNKEVVAPKNEEESSITLSHIVNSTIQLKDFHEQSQKTHANLTETIQTATYAITALIVLIILALIFIGARSLYKKIKKANNVKFEARLAMAMASFKRKTQVQPQEA